MLLCGWFNDPFFFFIFSLLSLPWARLQRGKEERNQIAKCKICEENYCAISLGMFGLLAISKWRIRWPTRKRFLVAVEYTPVDVDIWAAVVAEEEDEQKEEAIDSFFLFLVYKQSFHLFFLLCVIPLQVPWNLRILECGMSGRRRKSDTMLQRSSRKPHPEHSKGAFFFFPSFGGALHDATRAPPPPQKTAKRQTAKGGKKKGPDAREDGTRETVSRGGTWHN